MLDLHSWLYTTAPPTRTIRLTEAHGITTQTIVSSGTTVTETSIAVSTFTTTAVANDIYGGMNFWYGSATSPCVSRPPFPSIHVAAQHLKHP